MRTVYRYALTTVGVNEIKMPRNAKIIKVAMRECGPCMWADIPWADAAKQIRKFLISGTGHEVNDDAKYVGTFFQDDFVWHVWEVG